jgi:hypothetical protein
MSLRETRVLRVVTRCLKKIDQLNYGVLPSSAFIHDFFPGKRKEGLT